MRNVVLYIAMSLDGYVADADGGVDWLTGDGSEPDSLGSYLDFYQTIDTVILGKKTYDQIITKLSPDVWPYKDKKSYVISHQKIDNDQNIKQTDKNLRELIIDLKQEEGKNIWICGGASIVQQLINSDLIDQYHITIIPTILSKGIALFEHLNKKIDLKLIQTNNYNGMVDLIYKHK